MEPAGLDIALGESVGGWGLDMMAWDILCMTGDFITVDTYATLHLF